ncbi:hypothetical protein ABKV19_006564 [Rosa sericea]
MARQKRGLILSTRNDAHAASASSRMVGERDATDAGSDTQNNEQDLYLFCTPDNRVNFLFKKELKKSHVGSWGRIVLPKKEAEKYLPSLSDKEVIELMIKDALSNQEWGLTYKYWTNNDSRMYVLEHTGDFVRQTGVEVGDSIHLSRISSIRISSEESPDGNLDDEEFSPRFGILLGDPQFGVSLGHPIYVGAALSGACPVWTLYPFVGFPFMGLKQYISIRKVPPRPVHDAKPCSYQQQIYTEDNSSKSSSCLVNASTTAINNTTKTTNEDNSIDQEKNPNPTIGNNNNITLTEATTTGIYTYNDARTEEDESSSAVLLQQQHKEHILETNNLGTLFADHASSNRQTEEASNNSNNDVPKQLETSSQPAMAQSIVTMAEDNFDDWFLRLEMLPEIEHFDFNELIKDDDM